MLSRRFLLITSESDFARGDATESNDVTLLGWFGWVWGVCYAPIIQVLWLVKNWSEASGELLIVRGLSVSVVALPLTMDTRARYGKALGRRIGGAVTEWLFSAVTMASLVTLGRDIYYGVERGHIQCLIAISKMDSNLSCLVYGDLGVDEFLIRSPSRRAFLCRFIPRHLGWICHGMFCREFRGRAIVFHDEVSGTLTRFVYSGVRQVPIDFVVGASDYNTAMKMRHSMSFPVPGKNVLQAVKRS